MLPRSSQGTIIEAYIIIYMYSDEVYLQINGKLMIRSISFWTYYYVVAW